MNDAQKEFNSIFDTIPNDAELTKIESTSGAVCAIVEDLKQFHDIVHICVNEFLDLTLGRSRAAQKMADLRASRRGALRGALAIWSCHDDIGVGGLLVEDARDDFARAGAEMARSIWIVRVERKDRAAPSIRQVG